jgi:pyrroline-5-carboxylate reductase
MEAEQQAPLRRLAIIGGGKMGAPIAARVVETSLLPPERLVVSEPLEAARTALAQRLGIATTTSNTEAIRSADAVLLAVTPPVIPVVLDDLRGHVQPGQLVLSIAAGVELATIAQGLQHDAVIRVMPNTPAQVGQSISAWVASPAVTPTHKAQARAVLRSFGAELEVDREAYLDMVTAVSGSGPAWVMLMVEAMIDAGVQIGLRREWATELVLQTVSGSIALARHTGEHPAKLRNLVTTPGGTTAAGLYAMERAGLRAAMGDGFVAAYLRSQPGGAAGGAAGRLESGRNTQVGTSERG